MSLNLFTFSGRLGRDPEMYYSQTGTAYVKFSVAVSNWDAKNGETTIWVNATMFNEKRCEYLTRYAQKGSTLVVSGKLDVRPYTDRNGQSRFSVDVIANEFEIVAGRVSGEVDDTRDTAPREPVGDPGNLDNDDSDIPANAAQPGRSSTTRSGRRPYIAETDKDRVEAAEEAVNQALGEEGSKAAKRPAGKAVFNRSTPRTKVTEERPF